MQLHQIYMLLSRSILRPFGSRRRGGTVPGVETPYQGFYEADFVKTRGENCFLFIFGSF